LGDAWGSASRNMLLSPEQRAWACACRTNIYQPLRALPVRASTLRNTTPPSIAVPRRLPSSNMSRCGRWPWPTTLWRLRPRLSLLFNGTTVRRQRVRVPSTAQSHIVPLAHFCHRFGERMDWLSRQGGPCRVNTNLRRLSSCSISWHCKWTVPLR